MKMLNQFNVPLKLLKASNCVGFNLNETPKELEKYNLELQIFQDKEYRENPTNQNYLRYYD